MSAASSPAIRVRPRKELRHHLIGTGHSLNVAVAASLVLYKIAGLL